MKRQSGRQRRVPWGLPGPFPHFCFMSKPSILPTYFLLSPTLFNLGFPNEQKLVSFTGILWFSEQFLVWGWEVRELTGPLAEHKRWTICKRKWGKEKTHRIQWRSCLVDSLWKHKNVSEEHARHPACCRGHRAGMRGRHLGRV